MTAKLELHQLAGGKRAGELASLVDRLYRAGRRVVVWVADEGRRQSLDDFLWTFEKLSFVPHARWSANLGELEDPVVLLGEAANPNRADVLVVGDGLPPAQWAAAFAEIHDFLPPGEAGVARRAEWENAGFDVSSGDR